MRQAVAGAAEGLVVISNEQTDGRGRLGRKWHTLHQALAMSVLLKPDLHPAEVPKLSLLTAVALHEALSAFAPEIGIKWPNDLLVHGKKISGILTEMRCSQSKVNSVILGIGVNLAPPEQGWPDDINQAATDLSTVCHKNINRDEVLTAILASLDHWYSRFQTDGFSPIHQAWWSAHIASGKTVKVYDGEKYIQGIAHALGEDGALRLLVNGVDQRIIAGDVILSDEYS